MTHSRNITLLSLVNSGWMLVALTVIVLASCDAKVPPTFRTSVQVSPNVTLNVGVSGNMGPIIVMLHGFPEGSEIWQPVIDELNQNAEFRVFFPDQRGYNRSSRPNSISEYHIRHLVNDIDVLISTVSPNSPVTLVGHDWGGSVAWSYAFFYPQKVSGLYILNSPHPSVFQDMIRSSPAVRKAVPYMLPFIHTPDAVAAGMKLFNFKGLRSLYPPTVPTSLMDSLVDAWSQRNSVNTMVYWYPANFDTANILSWTGFNATFPYPLRIKVPTIVGWGMQDNIFQAEYNLPYVSSYVPQLKISQYPLGSHFPETDVPSAIAADIRALALGTAFPLV